MVATAPDYTNRPVRWWKTARYFVTIGAGAGAFTPLVMLMVREFRGVRWHAATTRWAVHVAFSPTTAGCRGLPYESATSGQGLRESSLLLSETLVIASTNHFWWLRLEVAFGITAAVYLAISVVPALYFWFRLRLVASFVGHADDGPSPTLSTGDGSRHGALALDMPADGVVAPPALSTG